MNILGFNISRSKAPSPRKNPLLKLFLNQWAWGKGLFHDRDFTRMLNSYRSWVYVCANRNASSVAQATLRLYVAKPNSRTKCRFETREINNDQKNYILGEANINNIPSVRKAAQFEEVLEHPFLTLIRNVNGFMNGFDLIETTQLQEELTGNGYWYILEDKIAGKYVPAEIWIAPPNFMKVIPDPVKFISGYEYRAYNMEKQFFPESSICHFKFPNPKNPYYGMSPLAAIAAAFERHENMDRYEEALFRNMGRLDGAFETDESLDEEEFQRLKQEIADSFYGVSNAGKAPLLEKGVSFKSYGLAPKEMAFLTGRKITKEEIMNAYGQSVALYDEKATRANADAATYNYARSTIRPRCIRMESKINEKILPKYDENLFVVFDNVVPEDQEQALKIRTENVRSGITAINEEREKLRMPPFKGLDEPLVQSQMIPVSAVLRGDNIKTGSSEPSQQDQNKPPKEPKKDGIQEYQKDGTEDIVKLVDDIFEEVEKRFQEQGGELYRRLRQIP